MKRTICFAVTLLTSLAHAQTDWYEINSNTTQALRSIDFSSESIGYIVGAEGVMLKTTDGGINWTPVSYTGIQVPVGQPYFTDVDFIDDLTGFVVVSNYSPGLYKTTDGGSTWVSDDPPTNMCYKNCVYPIDSDDYYLGGAGCFQSAMVDVHSSSGWTPGIINYESFNPSEFVAQIDFYDNVGVAAMNAPYILRSTDSGATWDTISTGISNMGVHTSVHFLNETICFAGYDDNGGGFGVLVSYDAGLTWQQDINSATFYYPAYLSVNSAANGDVYLGARPSGWPGQGLIFEFDGIGWLYETVAQPIYSLDSRGSDITFGVGDSGLIVVNTPLEILKLEDKVLTRDLTIFPNPTLGKVSAEFPGAENGEITVCDLEGRSVEVHWTRQTGSLSADISGLSNGVYVLTWTDGISQAQTRLVKQ